jgi:hypothetical protein
MATFNDPGSFAATYFPLGNAPSLADYMRARDPQAGGMPQATGTGNPITSGLSSGFHGALQDIGGFGEAAARAVGLNGLAGGAAQFAAQQQAAERAAANSQYENNPWSLGGIAYQVAKAVPSTVGILGGAALAPEAIGSTLAAGALSYPLAVGGNVAAARQARGDLSQGDAAKSLALGVPEAALGAIVPGQLAHRVGVAAEGALASRVFKGAAVSAAEQAGVGAAQTAITQEMGDPNRPIGDRAQEIVQGALGGALQGGLTGGVVHAFQPAKALAKTPPGAISTEALDSVVDQMMKAPVAPAPTAEPAPVASAQLQVEGPPARLALPAPESAPVAPESAPVAPEIPGQPTVVQATEPTGPYSEPALAATPEPPAPAVGAQAPSVIEPEPAVEPAPALGADVSPPAPPSVEDLQAARTEVMKWKAGKKPPETLTPVQVDALHQVLAEQQQNNDGALSKRLARIAADRKLNILEGNDPNGVVVAGKAETPPLVAPTELGAEEPGQPVGAASPRDAIPDAQKANFDRLEALRADIGDNPAIKDQIDKVQSLMLDGKKQSVKQASKVIDTIQKVAEGERAKADLGVTDAVQEPSAAGVSVREPSPGGEGVREGNAQGSEAAPQARQGNAQATSRQVSSEALQELTNRLDAARAALGKVQAGDVRVKKDDPSYGAAKAQFDDLTDAHDERLSGVRMAIKAAKAGDMGPLSKIDDDYFLNAVPKLATNRELGTNLYDRYNDQVNTATSKAIQAHAEAEARVLDQVHAIVRGETPRIAEQSGPQTPQDQDLEKIINQGGTGKDVLDYLKLAGSNGYVKAFAAYLSRRGVDPSLRFSTPDGVRFDNPRANMAGANVAASYNHDFGRVNVYDRSGLEQSLLHEMTHAATMDAFDQGGEASKEAQRIFNTLKARSPDNTAYGLTNPKEMIAEAVSNQRFREFLQGQNIAAGSRVSSMWQAVKNMVFKALGMPERMRTAFDQVMDVTDALSRGGAAARNSLGEETPSVRPGAPQDANAKLKEFTSSLEGLRENGAEMLKREAAGIGQNILPFFRAQFLQWRTDTGIAGDYKKFVPAMDPFVKIRDDRALRAQAMAQVSRAADRLTSALNPKQRENINDLMKYTLLNVDPRRPWEEHKWLFGEKNAAALRAETAVANEKWNQAKRDGSDKAYSAWKDANDAHLLHKMAVSMDDVIQNGFADKGIAGFEGDPFAKFQYASELHDSPSAASAYWSDVVNKMTGGIDAYRTALESTRKSDPEAFKASNVDRALLRSLRGDMQDGLDNLERAPNFHLGRQGDYYVSAKLPTNEQGVVDNAAISKVEERLQKSGFHNIALRQNGDNNSFYARVETPAQMENLYQAIAQLHKEGAFDKSEAVARGPISQLNVQRAVSPAWVKRAVDAARAAIPELPATATDKEKANYKVAVDKLVNQQYATWLDMLPDSSVRKIYQRRANVQGFDEDMIHNASKRAAISSNALGNLSTQRQISASAAAIKDQVTGLKQGMDNVRSDQIIAAHQAATELMTREAQRAWTLPTPTMDVIRGLTHSIEVGTSPAYFLTLMSQVGSLTWPELGKTHGFVNAAKAISGATNPAFKVMRATLKGPESATFGLSRDQLLKEGVPQGDVNFIMHHSNRGDFNLSSYTHAMQGHIDASTSLGKIRQWSSTLGLYSEMFPRVLTALAARDLANNQPNKVPARYKTNGELTSDGFHQFISDKIKGSQFDWNPANNPRAAGKGGFFGAAGPLINQFMGYKVRMLEKLHKEIGDAFGRNGPEQAAEARKFLAGHLIATTALAGTLGAPFAGAFAGAADRLADWFTGKDDFDVNASYRNFLSNTFGKDVGEVIARGLPRALGVDFSHLGDQNLLPGTQFLQEKRKMEDAEKDYLKTMAGSSAGLAMNVLAGLRDVSNGDIMDGLIKIAPEIVKGPLEAGRLANRGFVDKNGVKLPITANAQDIMATALGIDPAKEEEYDESRRVEQGATNLRELRSQNITRHMIQAYSRGDNQDLSKWIGQSTQFGLDHPGIPPPAVNLQDAIQEHMQSGALAKALGVPLGVKPNDIIGRGMTSFGNFRQ